MNLEFFLLLKASVPDLRVAEGKHSKRRVYFGVCPFHKGNYSTLVIEDSNESFFCADPTCDIHGVGIDDFKKLLNRREGNVRIQ